jgi:hypothetical protein
LSTPRLVDILCQSPNRTEGLAVIFRREKNEDRILRYLVYLSDVKLQLLFDQIDEPVRRSLAAELKLDGKLLGIILDNANIDPSLRRRGRLMKLSLVEKHLERNSVVGDATASRGFFKTEMMMDWKPIDGDTVLFCGYKSDMLVVLGGSNSHLLGQSPSESRIGSHSYAIRQSLDLAFGPPAASARTEDLGWHLDAAAAAIYKTPQRVAFLAHAIARGPLDPPPLPREYLLATPIFVELIDTDTSAQK